MSSSVATVLPEMPQPGGELAPPAPTSGGSPAAMAPPLFSPDRGEGATLESSEAAELLAELLCHRDAGTPMLVGLFGGAGSGKSSLLSAILERAEALSGSAAAREDGVFLPRVAVVRIDAAAGGTPAARLLQHLYAGLADRYPALAEEALHAGRDPREAARAAGEKVNDLRRQLDAERQTLDDLNGRRARLTEMVLFNAAGSRVDAYARANRARIEGRLRAFGLPATDAVMTYKDLVREAAEARGGLSRVGLLWRAIWGFKGQGALVTLAVLLVLAGLGLGYLDTHQASWIAWLDGFGDRMAPLRAWAADHAGWLSPLSHLAFALAALALLVDVVRAIRFLQPVLRGAAFLDGDIEGRRHDLDGLLAHQTRRVDHLGTEVEAAVRRAEAQDRRVQGIRSGGTVPSASLLDRDGAEVGAAEPAEAFTAGMSAALGKTGAQDVPGRVLVALDELDRLDPREAAAWLDTAQRLLARPGIATVAAFDRAHVLNGFAEADPALAAARLRRCVQLSYDLDAKDGTPVAATERPRTSDGASRLDRPWRLFETDLLRALGGFAGSHRGRKSLANRYRLARADANLQAENPSELAGLAIALALDGTPGGAELAGLADVRGGEIPPGSSVAAVAEAASAAIGAALAWADALRGMQVARLYAQG